MRPHRPGLGDRALRRRARPARLRQDARRRAAARRGHRPRRGDGRRRPPAGSAAPSAATRSRARRRRRDLDALDDARPRAEAIGARLRDAARARWRPRARRCAASARCSRSSCPSRTASETTRVTREAREQGPAAPLVRHLRQRDPHPRPVRVTDERARPRPRHPRSVRLAAEVAVEGARKTYGDVVAVDDVDLHVARRRVLHAARPVGLGQDDDAAHDRRLRAARRGPRSRSAARTSRARPPYARDVNTVFQDYALFPHMTVAENVGYGLKVKGVTRGERTPPGRARCCAMVRLDGYGDRKPVQLSGGQRQRVALARVDRQPAEGAAPRRAARRARPEAPPGDAGVPEGAPAGPRHDLPLRHARPGGGADDERPRRRLQRGPHRAGRDAGRDLRAARDRVRRRLRRHLEHPRARRPPLQRPAGADRARTDTGEPATVVDAVFVGAFTRYLVDTEARRAPDRRAPERRHADSSPARAVRLAWRDEDAYRDSSPTPRTTTRAGGTDDEAHVGARRRCWRSDSRSPRPACRSRAAAPSR